MACWETAMIDWLGLVGAVTPGVAASKGPEVGGWSPEGRLGGGWVARPGVEDATGWWLSTTTPPPPEVGPPPAEP